MCLTRLTRHPPAAAAPPPGLRVLEVRAAYCREGFEWDQLQRLAVRDTQDANLRLMRHAAAASLRAAAAAGPATAGSSAGSSSSSGDGGGEAGGEGHGGSGSLQHPEGGPGSA
jgi:hypothetical protein